MMLKFHTECSPGDHREFIEMVFYEYDAMGILRSANE